VASLSTGSDVMNMLKAKLDAVPDIRQQQVDGLRQAITNGQYAISSDRIAARMLGESTQDAS
jgi:flagellar biosynthesis anti-sigma factor FlgM